MTRATKADRPVPLRERKARLTRDLIMRAVADLLSEEDPGDVSVPAVAERSGVSLRTVYRYFPTRDELLAAAADWINEELLGGAPVEHTLDQLGEIYRSAFERFDERPGLVRAMALTEAGRSVRSHRRAQRLEGVRRALAEVTDRLPDAEARQAEAVFFHLANMLAWVTMREEGGLDGAQSGTAVSWAMETLIDDLRRRNNAAGASRKPTLGGNNDHHD